MIGGWILAGGQSRRMGQDKARLIVHGETLLVRTHRILSEVSAGVSVIAPNGMYADLGLSNDPDRRVNRGPLAGIETALLLSPFDWNLIVACDMPYLESSWLRKLVATALHEGQYCVSSRHPEKGLSPLCALWHRDALPFVSRALDENRLRVRDLAFALGALELTPTDPKILANWNEPGDIPA